MSNQEILDQEQQHYAKAARIKYFDIVIKSGKGAILTDKDDHQYIDLLSSASATNTGHCHPHVVEAIKQQAEQLIQYTPAYFANGPEAKLTPRLAKLAPINGPVKVAYGNSGSDANDAIIKFARAYTGRQYIVSFTGAYHGSTYGSISTSGVSLNMTRKIGPLLPGVVKVPFPSPWYRLPNESDDDFSDRMFDAFKLPFETYLPADETALIEIEAIQGDGGFIKAPERYLNKVYQFAKEHGILFAVDEVNQGLGRSGKMWSIQHFPDVHPDLIAVGKSIASGLPLSAVLGRAEVMDALSAPGNLYTTAGNPVTTASANATLDVIENEHLVERSAKLGKQAKAFFDKMKDRFDFIGDVRIYGLNGGIDIVDPATGKADDDAATQLITQIFELGALMITVRGNILRFQPPLVIKETDLNKAFSIIEQAMQELNDGKLPPAKPMGW
ncbi:aspartate aminotransferase family protein [Fructilactobacillus sanfranciscensis]|uniref:Aspartate aminotransferase family protein n=1 Tax=Fructilactobacillus sanfranciscensis TaxID=1625 RepID=A0A5C4THR6_FRUSA|nr:aspartate aminotransferase family protein [Fructilactobacillus sanfranciscensis]MVF15502.1 aspartate aminotransferase family protein [Fructilactobacillus sanfranciscensis]TNK89998.1 aspartate aminotransferase family protein [Fructilactobacillus sanfranciscensis]TNK98698.1 aspartate aminotransferase family protein [Fructilactobacillus sanfranciscensis]TNL00442.1 aspartate aminotransferase family protein [Fructilactobacillus sanfranciscensis]